jgi:hypothetical protein
VNHFRGPVISVLEHVRISFTNSVRVIRAQGACTLGKTFGVTPSVPRLARDRAVSRGEIVLYALCEQGSLMESSSRIALGVVAAAALLLVGYIGYSEFQRHRDIAEAQAALSSLAEQGRQVVAQAQQQEWQQAWDLRRQQVRDEVNAEQSRRLSGNQRCVGGVVVVDGASYTQLGTVGDLVRCNGQYADRPIR